MSSEMFTRNPKGMTETLGKRCVAIAGCGGLGSNAAVALTRAGIGKLILVDFDKVEESNLNRQYFFRSDLGKVKSEALAIHLKGINPDIELEVHNEKIETSTVETLFGSADILIEAFDKAESKKWLIETWATKYPQKPVVCGSGVSGFGNSSALKIHRAGNIFLCGDEVSELSMGLCSARVAIAANMQANTVIELLLNGNIAGI
jgi:sulfur carrier protein ThiS adenylyltransferase